MAEYPIALVAGSKRPELARGWVAFLLGAEGQRAMRQAGFLPPSRSVETP
jgi:ABC-type Fe3+ transport system substrate-binding protein